MLFYSKNITTKRLTHLTILNETDLEIRGYVTLHLGQMEIEEKQTVSGIMTVKLQETTTVITRLKQGLGAGRTVQSTLG